MLEFLINNDSNLFVGAGVAVAAVMAVKYMNARADAAQQRAYEAAKARQEALKAEREKPIKRRFFTPEEMLPFNGEDGQPIYIAVLDEVYDVSRKRDFYGPGEGYHLFAGRDASRALAKMSFEQEDLDSEDLSDLSFMDKETLQDWVTKFSVYNSYPNVGRVLRRRDLTLEQLKPFNGVDNPRKIVYVAVNGNIYDVTLDGMNHYGPDGGYKQFAGRDCSRSLACMSFVDEYLDNPTVDGLTEQQQETLNKWEEKFQEKYPVVGKGVVFARSQRKPPLSSIPIMGNAVGTPPSGPSALLSSGRRGSATDATSSRRHFTVEQLAAFNGADSKQPIYISVKSDVYDVSASRNEYGPSGRFAALAGRDITKAVATNGLDDEKELASLDLSNLTPEQFQTLDEWLDKFQSDEHKYANVGRLVDSNLHLTPEDLLPFNGADNPRKMILVGVNGVLYDVTLNGSEFYGLDGMYGQFAGRDASRALACMSLEAETLDDPTLDQITPEQRKTLDDWIKRFEGKYAVVGKLSAARRK
ncbi:hypothetical protein BBO99_00003258 [Phytophthora kernoviae]|uniref:Cytochrome b5 heme-binding domain-containing protein n=1 Tax=Phytophthora kernoviae TaxID=325452 RepID=A0A3R7NIS1_9STRA|nr:hypothetical protein JM16_002846 [Phytophthora kernoviae]RLN82004.1 hypothetical protein BBO99_00003258 [Phytophthora kernoviae]